VKEVASLRHDVKFSDNKLVKVIEEKSQLVTTLYDKLEHQIEVSDREKKEQEDKADGLIEM